jgi:hypothetical protein
MLGYVDNEAALTLGIPAGTKSQAARERAEQMEDYITKQALDLEQFKEEQQIKMQYDKEMIRYSNSFRSVGVGGGSSGGTTVDGDTNYVPSKYESDYVQDTVSDYTKMISDKEFDREDFSGKSNAIKSFVSNVIKNGEQNIYGENSYYVASMILEQLEQDPVFQQYYKATIPMYYDENGYVRTQEGR